MAELTISSDEIRTELDDYASSSRPELSREEVGTVTSASDGIPIAEGLPSTMPNDLLDPEDRGMCLAIHSHLPHTGAAPLP